MVWLYNTVTSVYSSITMVYDTYKYSIHVTMVYEFMISMIYGITMVI